MTEECTLDFSPGGPARLAGALGFETCRALHEAMEKHRDGGDFPALIDLGGITAADSAGLALLLEWQASSRASGREIRMTGAPESLLRLARLCDAVELLNLAERATHEP